MFTGIIEAVGSVTSLKLSGKEGFIEVENPFGKEIKTGDSIAVDGTCLTVTNLDASKIGFFVSGATISATKAAHYKKGAIVNLERAMQANGRFDGHIVTGHVDTVGRITAVNKIEKGIEIDFTIDESFSQLIVDRGSVAVDGISLTIASAKKTGFTVSVIPETLKRTAFDKNLKAGMAVNIEFDILGKYVQKIVGKGKSDIETLLKKL